MQQNTRHIHQLEAIRFIDGELSSPEAADVELHVEQCEDCSQMLSAMNARLAQLRGAISNAGQPVYSREQANSLLKSKLMETQIGSHKSVQTWLSRSANRTQLLRYAASVAVVAVGMAVLSHGNWVGKLSGIRTITDLPDKSLTPGVVRQVSLTEICESESDEDLDPAVPPSMQKKVFYEYGVPSARQRKDFQVDYLINPQLGGTNDIHNLWPQPYNSAEWNAEAKDALERHLHRMVCERKLDLAEAQRDISTNWIAAYQKYFHTAKPV